MKTILVTGSAGLVGSRFVELSSRYKLLTPSHLELDIANTNSLDQYLNQHTPDLVINFAAYTNVTEAENQINEKDSPCWQINVTGVQNLLNTKIPLIQISTDMVFSGSLNDPGPYEENHTLESDPTHLTWYGWSKNQAERLVLENNQTVVRIIYPVRAHFENKLNYLRLPLSLYKHGKLYPLFDDQQVSFTFIDELVDTLHKLIKAPHPGVYHVSSNTFTPYELVTYTIARLGGDTSSIQTNKIRSYLEKQANHYRYPIRGGLQTTFTQSKLGIKFKTWKEVINELIKQGLTI